MNPGASCFDDFSHMERYVQIESVLLFAISSHARRALTLLYGNLSHSWKVMHIWMLGRALNFLDTRPKCCNTSLKTRS